MAFARILIPLFQKVSCEEDRKSLCQIVMPGIFLLKSESSSAYCGGFFINNKGFGISAYHFYTDLNKNLKDCVIVYNGKNHRVKLVDANEENHIILVCSDTLKSTPFLKFSDKKVELGSEVALFSSNPFEVSIFEPGYFLESNYSPVTQVKFPCFRTSCRGGPGYSGGALVNEVGEVIGMHKSFSGLFEVYDSISIPNKNILEYLQKRGKCTEDGWIFR